MNTRIHVIELMILGIRVEYTTVCWKQCLTLSYVDGNSRRQREFKIEYYLICVVSSGLNMIIVLVTTFCLLISTREYSVKCQGVHQHIFISVLN